MSRCARDTPNLFLSVPAGERRDVGRGGRIQRYEWSVSRCSKNPCFAPWRRRLQGPRLRLQLLFAGLGSSIEESLLDFLEFGSRQDVGLSGRSGGIMTWDTGLGDRVQATTKNSLPGSPQHVTGHRVALQRIAAKPRDGISRQPPHTSHCSESLQVSSVYYRPR